MCNCWFSISILCVLKAMLVIKCSCDLKIIILYYFPLKCLILVGETSGLSRLSFLFFPSEYQYFPSEIKNLPKKAITRWLSSADQAYLLCNFEANRRQLFSRWKNDKGYVPLDVFFKFCLFLFCLNAWYLFERRKRVHGSILS